MTLLFSVFVYFGYDEAAGGYQFAGKTGLAACAGYLVLTSAWMASALPLVLMAGIVLFCGVLISWNVEERPREFFCLPDVPGRQCVGRVRLAGSVHAVLLL